MGDAAMELNEEQFDKLTDRVVRRIGQRIPSLLTSVPGGGTVGSGGSPESAVATPILYVPPEFWEAHVEFRNDIAAIRTEMAVFRERFEAVDKRFDDLIHYMDKRFGTLQWSMGIGFILIVALMSLYNFVG